MKIFSLNYFHFQFLDFGNFGLFFYFWATNSHRCKGMVLNVNMFIQSGWRVPVCPGSFQSKLHKDPFNGFQMNNLDYQRALWRFSKFIMPAKKRHRPHFLRSLRKRRILIWYTLLLEISITSMSPQLSREEVSLVRMKSHEIWTHSGKRCNLCNIFCRPRRYIVSEADILAKGSLAGIRWIGV